MTDTPVQTRFEVAPGADRTADPATWPWQDETRLGRAPVVLKVGRDDEEGETPASNTTLLVKNSDGRWTPRNPTSGLYPHVDAGMPARVVTIGGRPHLTLSGQTGASEAKASTVNHPSLQIVGDLSGIVELVPFWTSGPGLAHEVVGRHGNAGNRSWLVDIWNDHKIEFRWSPDGTNVLTAVTTVPLPRPDTMSALGWWIDVANGANRVITFYWAYTDAEILANPTGHILEQITQAGNTSIHAGTADLVIGDIGPFRPFPGMVRSFQLRSGDLSTGTIVANPDFAAQAEGATALTDSASRPWTFPALDRRHIRLSGDTGAIRPVWPENGVAAAARSRVTVSGPLRRLGQGDKRLDSALRRLVTSPVNRGAVKAYWPMEDERQATTAASPIPGVAQMAVGGLDFASSADLDGSKPLPTISAGEAGAWVGIVPAFTTTFWSADWFVDLPVPATSPAVTDLQEVNTTGTARRWLIQANSANVTVTATDATDANVFAPSTYPWDARFAFPSVLRLEIVQNGGNVDWAMRWVPIYGAGAGLSFGVTGSYAGTAGRPTRVANVIESAPPEGITIGHMVVADQRGIGWLAPADSAYVGERAAERFKRLCDEEGIPNTIIGDPDLSEPMGPQRTLSLTGLLRECRDVDMGIMGEQRYHPGISYRTRASLQNQPVRLAIVKPRNPFEPAADDLHLRNDIEVQRPGGSSDRQVDQAHIDSKGLYDDSLSVNVHTEDQLPSQARWRLHLGTWPEMRYGSLTAGLRGQSDTWLDTWLHFCLGDRFTQPDVPAGHPPDPLTQLAQGWTETLESFDWETEIACSPAGPWEVGVRDDDGRGKRDTDGSELAASFAAGSATSMSVTITTGALWTTDAAEMPFDIAVSGARLTVTAVSGAASPQTFTIAVTPVNGVVKTILAGTAVRLWRPTVRAL